jgi:hypothetical protein
VHLQILEFGDELDDNWAFIPLQAAKTRTIRPKVGCLVGAINDQNGKPTIWTFKCRIVYVSPLRNGIGYLARIAFYEPLVIAGFI